MSIACSGRRCPFPNCVLEEHETGDHKFGRPEKPWCPLRLSQVFQLVHMRCETCPPFKGGGLKGFPLHTATAFYNDRLGFGWALCTECAEKFSTFTTETPRLEEPVAFPSPQPAGSLASSPAPVSPVVNRPAVVISFNRRAR